MPADLGRIRELQIELEGARKHIEMLNVHVATFINQFGFHNPVDGAIAVRLFAPEESDFGTVQMNQLEDESIMWVLYPQTHMDDVGK